MKKLLILSLTTITIHASQPNFEYQKHIRSKIRKEAISNFSKQIDEIDTKIFQAPEKVKNQAIAAGVLGGLFAYHGPSIVLDKTRFSGIELGIVTALSVGATLGAVYFYIGNQMNTIAAFKSDLERALEELNKLQPQVSTLATEILSHKDNLKQTTEKVDVIHTQVTSMNQQEVNVDDFITVSENTLEAVKETQTEVTKNRNLLKAFYPRLKALEGMLKALPKKEQDEIFATTGINPSILESSQLADIINDQQQALSDEEKESIKKALKEYNSNWFRKKATVLTDIPDGWFRLHEHEDLIPLKYRS